MSQNSESVFIMEAMKELSGPEMGNLEHYYRIDWLSMLMTDDFKVHCQIGTVGCTVTLPAQPWQALRSDRLSAYGPYPV